MQWDENRFNWNSNIADIIIHGKDYTNWYILEEGYIEIENMELGLEFIFRVIEKEYWEKGNDICDMGEIKTIIKAKLYSHLYRLIGMDKHYESYIEDGCVDILYKLGEGLMDLIYYNYSKLNYSLNNICIDILDVDSGLMIIRPYFAPKFNTN
jgi:hypothetical protein